ncbi:hypothetical protein LZ32DRAFT_601598 [Colletotrichum eremochloae]|nr:hypothetical protein LZ32DRAFT_601598 [Colletotrichum eremochloae]
MESTNDNSYGSKGFLDMSASYLDYWIQRNTNSSATSNHLATDVHSQHSTITGSWNPEVTVGAPMDMGPSCMLPELGANAQKEPASCKNTPQASSCIKVATNVLMSMRSNSPSCLMGTHDCSSLQLPDAAVDSVLSAAQEALYAVRRLLGCPCHANPQWQLLLAVICAEIITSYRRVINTYGRHRHTPSTVHLGRGDDTLSKQGQHPENTSLLKRTPILIGNYHIEGSIETILIGHVLRKRLQALERLMGEVFQFVGHSEEMIGVKNGIETFLGVQLSTVKYGLASLQSDEGSIVDDLPSRGAGT